jgi:SAM-dependent methyltransferase
MMPNDEKEQERLDLAHQIFKMLLRGHLHRTRLPHAPRNVLDFGTGTGSWAIDFADIHPDSHVVGIDLSPIQPSNIPPNCRFFVDDIESPWTFESKFDFIHARAMCGSIRDWDTLLHQALENLNEDGVIELQEYEAVYRSDDGTLERTEAIRTWQRQLNDASERYVCIYMRLLGISVVDWIRVGQPMNSAETLKVRLEACGFVDVRDDAYKVHYRPIFIFREVGVILT